MSDVRHEDMWTPNAKVGVARMGQTYKRHREKTGKKPARVKVGLEAIKWNPRGNVPQIQFVESEAQEVLYGGAAGGGKSAGLVADAMQQAHKQGYTAVLFRKTIKQLEGADGLIVKSREFYRHTRAVYKSGQGRWDFANEHGNITGEVYLRHLAEKRHLENYEGLAYAYIGFDELQHFQESDYLFMFSRNRSVNPDIQLKIRATANPGGRGHIWIRRRWAAWIDEKYETALENGKPKYAIARHLWIERGTAYPGRPAYGEIRWFLRDERTNTDTEVPEGTTHARSRTFIPARVQDNWYLTQDDQYLSNLMNLPLIDRERLLNGDWNIMNQGNIIKKSWFRTIRTPPPGLQWFRGVDCASSEDKKNDATAYAEVAFDGLNNLYIRYIAADRLEWVEQRKWMRNVILQDPIETAIEKADNGKALYDDFRKDPEVGLRTKIFSVQPDRDKLERAGLWTYRAEAGQVYIVEGTWNEAFYEECEVFDGSGKGGHDDRIDAVSIAVTIALKRLGMLDSAHSAQYVST